MCDSCLKVIPAARALRGLGGLLQAADYPHSQGRTLLPSLEEVGEAILILSSLVLVGVGYEKEADCV